MPDQAPSNLFDAIEEAIRRNDEAMLRVRLPMLIKMVPKIQDLIEPLLSVLELPTCPLDCASKKEIVYPLLKHLDAASDQQERASKIICEATKDPRDPLKEASAFFDLMAEASDRTQNHKMFNMDGPRSWPALFERANQNFRKSLASFSKEDESQFSVFFIALFHNCFYSDLLFSTTDPLFSKLLSAYRERLAILSDPMAKVEITHTIATCSFLFRSVRDAVAEDFKKAVDDLPQKKQRLERFRKECRSDNGSHRLTDLCALGVLENIDAETETKRRIQLLGNAASLVWDDNISKPLTACLIETIESLPTEEARLSTYESARTRSSPGSSYEKTLLSRILQKAGLVEDNQTRGNAFGKVIDLATKRHYDDIKHQALATIAQNPSAFPDYDQTSRPLRYVLDQTDHNDPLRRPILKQLLEHAKAHTDQKKRAVLFESVARNAQPNDVVIAKPNDPLLIEALEGLLHGGLTPSPQDQPREPLLSLQYVAKHPLTQKKTRLVALQGLYDLAETTQDPNVRRNALDFIIAHNVPHPFWTDRSDECLTSLANKKGNPFLALKQKALTATFSDDAVASNSHMRDSLLTTIIKQTSKDDPLHQQAAAELQKIEDARTPKPPDRQDIQRFLQNIKGIKGEQNTRS